MSRFQYELLSSWDTLITSSIKMFEIASIAIWTDSKYGEIAIIWKNSIGMVASTSVSFQVLTAGELSISNWTYFHLRHENRVSISVIIKKNRPTLILIANPVKSKVLICNAKGQSYSNPQSESVCVLESSPQITSIGFPFASNLGMKIWESVVL